MRIVGAILVAGILALTGGSAALAREPEGRAVSLSDASRPPTYLRLLRPHRSLVKEHQCPRYRVRHGDVYKAWYYWSDVNVYRWTGRALGPQRWNRAGDRMYWPRRGRGRGRVYFDGIRFWNGTRHAVLVAGWCERDPALLY